MKQTSVNKPNRIIMAGQSLTNIQSKILYSMLSRFKYLAGTENQEELAQETYTFPIEDFIPNFNTSNGGESYKTLRTHLLKLHSQVLQVQNTDGSPGFVNIVSKSDIITGTKTVITKFNNDIIPILANMTKDGYTPIVFDSIYKLKGAHSIRLYELIEKQRRHPKSRKTGSFTIELSEFRFLFGITDKYPAWKDLNKRVLTTSHKEIEEKTDLRFTIEPTRIGRSITSLKFSNICNAEPTRKKDKSVDNSAPEQATIDFVACSEPNPLLDGLQPSSRKEIEARHSEEYISHYHTKAKRYEKRNRINTSFEDLLYSFLMQDKDEFYSLEKRITAKAENRTKAEADKAAAAAKKEKQAQQKDTEEKERIFAASAIFNQLSESKQSALLEDGSKKYPYLKLTPKLLNQKIEMDYAVSIGVL